VFVPTAGAAIALFTGVSGYLPSIAIVVAAASGGFLLWNWPPARIFMGDVGSGYTGYVLAVLAILAARESPVAALVWLILSGGFVVDATLTFARRLARFEKVYQAHRTHAYQRLAYRWQSHRRVTLLLLLINVVWLFPSALLAALRPTDSAWIAGLALLPVLMGAFAAGAGVAADVRDSVR
jgi:Fuc2NAc and GlcNAc transferase